MRLPEIDFAGRGLVNAREQIEYRCFARAVWSDETINLAALYIHVQRVNCGVPPN